MCPAVGVSLQELAIGAASRSTVARFLIDARRRDGVMTQCVGRLGLKQLPMPVDVPTSRLLALSYRLVDGSQTIQACRSAAQGFDRLNPNGYFKFKEADSIVHVQGLKKAAATKAPVAMMAALFNPLFCFGSTHGPHGLHQETVH